MRVGVIGVGAIGGTIARRLRENGHEVRVANSRGAAGAQAFAREIGAMPTDVRGVAEGADAVVLSIPFPAVRDLPGGLFSSLPRGIPVIDTGNYYPDVRDPRIPEIDAGMPESVWVSEQLGRPVVKAFNNILAWSLEHNGKPSGAPGRLALAVAGDDPAEKAVAMALVDAVGFEPVDSGSLDESWRQQPGTPAYCCDYGADQMRAGLAAAVRGVGERRRDDPRRQEWLGENPTHQHAVELQRRLNTV